MKYANFTKEQQAQELRGRITALERKHFLRSMDLTEAQAKADALSDPREAMAQVGVIMHDIEQIELSLNALNGK